MFNKRRSIIIVKFLITLLSLILMLILMDRTLSRYEVVSSSQAKIQAAFYLMKDDYQSMAVKLETLEPRNEEYTYTFSIANNDNTKRTETSLEYDLEIITTTNLPLDYELYMNEDYTNGATSIVTSDVIAPDEYGTYFRTISTAKQEFGHLQNEANIYTLVVHFPEEYKSTQYQDTIESIEIKVNSRQLIEGDNA